jgi:hypothetical protein
MNKTTKRNIIGSILCLLSCCILGGLASGVFNISE